MVTKVGRRGQLLICSDCGRPVEKREVQLDNRRRLYGALCLIGLSLAGGMIFFLAAMDERLAPGAFPGGQRDAGAGNREEGLRIPEPALLAPEPAGPKSLVPTELPIKTGSSGHAHGLAHGPVPKAPSAGPLSSQQRTHPRKERPEP